jgi:hypothetical protein
VSESQFDELAKEAAGGSRRAIVKASIGVAIGGAFGLRGIRSSLAARGRPDGSTCRDGSDCASENCIITDDKHGRGFCGKRKHDCD